MWKVTPKTPHTHILCRFQFYKLPLKTNRVVRVFWDFLEDFQGIFFLKSRNSFCGDRKWKLTELGKVRANDVSLFVLHSRGTKKKKRIWLIHLGPLNWRDSPFAPAHKICNIFWISIISQSFEKLDNFPNSFLSQRLRPKKVVAIEF